MNLRQRVASLAMVAALGLFFGNVITAAEQATQTPAAAGGQEAGAAKQPYTMPEYNTYQAAASEKNPVQQVKLLDDFVSRYPNSALVIYVYPLYYQAYTQQKNYAKVIEYSDKLIALGDKVDPAVQYQALYARAIAYNGLNSTDPAQAKAALAAAAAGLQALDKIKKPDNMTDDAFAAQKKPFILYLNGTAAQAATVMKDYPTAIKFYQTVLTVNPDDAISSYRLGLAYMQLTPPQPMDAFWSIARAVTAKSATEAQSKQVKAYLRKLIVNYQQAACDTLTDAEMNELLQLVGSSPQRPDSYKLPSSADLDAARKDMTIASVITDLKAGGDKAKVTWLAACGLDFPEVPGKVIEVTTGTDVELKVAFVTSEAEFESATTPNMDVKVVGQPEAARLEKGSPVHFTATLASYNPDPSFMIHWEKGKVKAEDLPKEKGPAKKPAAKRPATRKRKP